MHRAELYTPPLVANRSACSHTCEHTRRSSFVRRSSIGDTRTRERAREGMESVEGSCGRRRDAAGPAAAAARWKGRFISLRLRRRLPTLVFIASGGHARVCACASFLAWKSHGLVRADGRAYACAYPYARVRRPPRCTGELPTVRGVHHPRLTGGTRSLPSRPLKPPSPPFVLLWHDLARWTRHERLDDRRLRLQTATINPIRFMQLDFLIGQLIINSN